MSRLIMPSFGRFQEEAAIIGRLLAGYGEVEYWMMNCVGEAIEDDEAALRVIFRTRSEKQRLDIADALMRPKYEKANLGSQYADSLGAMRHCRKIRNQFAHAHWLDFQKAGLFFFDLQKAAEGIEAPMLTFRHVDVALLEQHEAYFCYAVDCFSFLQGELRKLRGQLKENHHPMPAKRRPPNLHNPPEKHPVPRLGTDSPNQP